MTTYEQAEASAHSGAPVELFRFIHGLTIWTYSSGPAIEYNGETYASLAVGRGDVGQTSEIHKNDLKISLPRTSEIAQLFLVGSPESIVSVTVFRQHHGASGTVVYWKGRIASVSMDGIDCQLTCESIFTSMKRLGLRAKYLRLCRHALYRRGCRLDMEDYAVAATCTAVSSSGTVLTVTEAGASPDTHYQGGIIRTASGALRFITRHAGTSMTLSHPLLGLETPAAIEIFPGCKHTRDACKNKFSNLANFGGFPWIPLRNPFDGRSIT